MSISSLARSERSDICDAMLEFGPAAPTLDEGWNVVDLAAHLVAREHDVWATPGIVLGGPFAAAMEVAMRRRRRQGLPRLVDTIRRGAPFWWNALPSGAMLTEYYIHHEDVRRANGGGPRRDRPDLDEALARLVRSSGRFLLAKVEAGVDVVWNGGVLYRQGDEPRAVLSGPPGELILYLSGRRSPAEVELAGDEVSVENLRTAELGL